MAGSIYQYLYPYHFYRKSVIYLYYFLENLLLICNLIGSHRKCCFCFCQKFLCLDCNESAQMGLLGERLEGNLGYDQQFGGWL